MIIDHRPYLQVATADGYIPMGNFEISREKYECRYSLWMESQSLRNLLKLDYDNFKAHKEFWDDD